MKEFRFPKRKEKKRIKMGKIWFLKKEDFIFRKGISVFIKGEMVLMEELRSW